jgi:quinol monooxygenase YgiN
METSERSEIVSTASVTVRPEHRKELYLTISSLVSLITSEDGCRTYRFYAEAGDQNSLLLIGQWKTREAWDHHLKSDNFAVLVGSLRLLSEQTDVDFQLLSHVTGIEALTKARCDPDKELHHQIVFN